MSKFYKFGFHIKSDKGILRVPENISGPPLKYPARKFLEFISVKVSSSFYFLLNSALSFTYPAISVL